MPHKSPHSFLPEYALRLFGISSLLLTFFCKGYDSYDYLDGKFINQNSQLAPTLIAPENNGIASLSTQFSWTTAIDARSYRVEISVNANMSSPLLKATVKSSPYKIANADLIGMTTIPEQAYYWRVVTVFPTKEEFSTVFKFTLYDKDIIYVDLNSTALTEIGNQNAPFKSIQPALNFAVANGRSKVYVSKGDYVSTIQLVAGVTLQGGYDALAMWSRNVSLNLTRILNTTNSINIYCSYSADATMGIDGFTIQNTMATGTTYGIRCEGASPTISNNIFKAASAPTVYGIYNAFSSPQISSNVFSYPFVGGTTSVISIYNYYSSPTISSNTFTGALGATTTIGISNDNSSATISSNTISIGGVSTNTAKGILNITSSNSIISNNSINSYGTTNAYGIDTTTSSALISGNTISVSNAGSSTTYGIYVSFSPPPVIINNLINGGSTSGINTGIHIDFASPTIANNTINGGGGTTSYGINMVNSSAPLITNNIIFTTGGTTRYGVLESLATSDPASFQNNLIFDCPTALYRDESTTNRTTEASLNTAASTTQGGATTAAGNLGPTTIANFAAVNFVSASDLHLTASTPATVRDGGKDSSQSTCGSAGTSSCGNVTTDRDGFTRTVPYSIGAYEF